MVRAQNRHTDQWNRVENPQLYEINLQLYGQFLAKQERRSHGKRTVFSTNGVGRTGQLYEKE